MLIGYLSDEMHVAIADAHFEFMRDGRSIEARSRASGAVHAELEPGEWRVVLAAPGHTRKETTVSISADAEPIRFRLLSDRLLGYAWPKWVRAGDQGEIRVHATEPFTVTLWRYGWEPDLVADLGLFDSFGPGGDRQIVPDGDFTRTGVRWNQNGVTWPVGDQYRLVAPERSALYYFHVRTRSGQFFSFPWIVAPREPQSRIAVLASNIDWNAYNDFGGRSNYVAAGSLPIEPAVNVRQRSPFLHDTGARFWDREDYDPLSFDRPEVRNQVLDGERINDKIMLIGAEHLAPATWRLVGWMEREGIEHDLYAETQLEDGTLDLDRYEVLVLDAHPEYWTRNMYFTVKRWVDERGGKLMYLGGNGINCEVEIADGAVVHRNGDLSGWLPTRSFTGGSGSILVSRFSRRVEWESSLLGVATTLTGMGTGAPYEVRDESHWVFEGTGLRNGDRFGEAWLDMRNPGGASGHETDKRNESTPLNAVLLAKGTNPHEGGGEIVYYETASGGAVYSVGSISYTCSLPVDEPLSRITANVVRRFLG